MWIDDVIPFSMKARWFDVNASHLVPSDFAASRIAAMVQTAGDFQPLGCRRAGYQTHNRFVIPQRLAPPIGIDVRAHPVVHLVPLAGSRTKVAHRHCKALLVGQVLLLPITPD